MSSRGAIFRTRTCALMLLAALLLPAGVQAAAKKGTLWLVNYDRAMSESRAQDKVVLAYFSGSDWDPWCQKLDTEVLNSDLFEQWAKQHVILLRVDFPRERPLSATLHRQNERLKDQYSVAKTPTFVFLDSSGEPIARAGYNDARLRDDEHKGEPKAWIAYLNNVLQHLPPPQRIDGHGGFATSAAYAKSRYGIMLILVTHGHVKYALRERDDLIKNQQFVKFVNKNVTFVNVDWPDDADMSAQAQSFRTFATAHKIAPVQFQLIVWDAPLDRIKARIFTYDPNRVDELISRVQAQLPHIDYTGGWITDLNVARTIAAQQDRDVFVVFSRMDGEWSQRMDQEIFQTDAFKHYAHKGLVLVRIDYSNPATQPQTIFAENKRLADLFNIRGYPTVVVINPLGQKLARSKYMKGGPVPFLAELSPILQRDKYRRTALKD